MDPCARQLSFAIVVQTLAADDEPAGRCAVLAPGATLLRGFAVARAVSLWNELGQIASRSPFRHMMTPGGFRMSVATTSCGAWGWLTDEGGYHYEATDPLSGAPWPAMPAAFAALADEAAAAGGFPGFEPDSCLINRYVPGARMSLHQDKDERDLGAPIVSVSLGLPATFLFGGDTRRERPQRVPLSHGDVVVWGGPARMRYHGVLPVKPGVHSLTGASRLNLTFRSAH